MKWLYLIFIAIIPIGFVVSCSSGPTTVYINDVHDGDTIKSSKGEKFRIFGIDTPEVSAQQGNWVNPDTGHIEAHWVDSTGIEAMYGHEATIAARELLLDKTVEVIRITKGKYGRTVARIVCDGTDLGLMLVKKGLARVAYISLVEKNMYYTSEVDYYHKLIDAQYYAAIHKKGIWKWKDRFKEIFPKSH